MIPILQTLKNQFSLLWGQYAHIENVCFRIIAHIALYILGSFSQNFWIPYKET